MSISAEEMQQPNPRFQIVVTCCDCRRSMSYSGDITEEQHWFGCPNCHRIVAMVNFGKFLTVAGYTSAETTFKREKASKSDGAKGAPSRHPSGTSRA